MNDHAESKILSQSYYFQNCFQSISKAFVSGSKYCMVRIWLNVAGFS